ncbi:MAG: adenosylcobinamide-GDP ribazoletransferase, partial [Paracoccaceae bacterium]
MKRSKRVRLNNMSDSLQAQNFRAIDIAAAFGLLSILPVPVDPEEAGERMATATWAYPLVGAGLGTIAAVFAIILGGLGAPSGILAALTLGFLAFSTGAMHEDGLADCADGIGGGRDVEARLLIMKDSRIGAFGAVALGVALLARWSGLEGLIDAGHLFWPLVAIGAASRLPMVLAMFLMPPARADGLAAGVGMPPPASILMACGITVIICLLALGWGAVPLLFWVVVATLPLFYFSMKRIGGQTGDVLGGSQQLAEIAGFAVALAAVS